MKPNQKTSQKTHGGDCWCQNPVMARIRELYNELLSHGGFGELRLDVRILKRGQREIVITCGKQYRYVVDMAPGVEDDESDEGVLPARDGDQVGQETQAESRGKDGA